MTARSKVLPAQSETMLVRACLQLLAARGVFAFRVNQQGVPLHDGTGRYRKGPTRGVSDILGILPGGVFLALECKRRRDRMATQPQLDFLQAVTAAGGIGMTCYDVAELANWLDGYQPKIGGTRCDTH